MQDYMQNYRILCMMLFLQYKKGDGLNEIHNTFDINNKTLFHFEHSPETLTNIL